MTLRIGHRGAAGTHPENTMCSFRRAIALGVDGLEFDVHRTRDGHLVVIHDPFLERTTTGTGLVRAHTLAEIQQLDAGRWKGAAFAGERVPTLRDLMREVPPEIRLFLELKAGSLHYPGIEQELVQLLQAENALTRVQVSSFDHRALRLLHELAPDLEVGMLYSENLIDPIGLAEACGAQALHPHWVWVTPDLVRAAKAASLGVYVWTVNDAASIAQMRAVGVDGVMSDFPELLST